MKGYLYLATDGIDDFKKFGITNNLDIRLLNYNSSEHIRPVFFEETYVFPDYKSARDAETKLREELKDYIKQTYHIETFVWNEVSKQIFYKNVYNFERIDYKNNFAGSSNSEKFPYYKKILELIELAQVKSISNTEIENLIIKNKIGYYKEYIPKRIILENRAKFLVKLTDKELYWDNKPRMLNRMERFYRLEEDIVKIINNHANISPLP